MKKPAPILIDGAGPEGMQAALTLARLGKKVVLIDQAADVGQTNGKLSPKEWRWLEHLGLLARAHPLIELRTQTRVRAYRLSTDGIVAELSQEAAWVESDECVGCEKCLAACPVELEGKRPISMASAPNTALIDKRRTPPCREACPLGMHVQGYVALIAQGRFDEANNLIHKTNPLPRVLGRICHHPCEAACRRSEVDAPIAICALKRFAGDEAVEAGQPAPAHLQSRGPKVAVIGAGPAGLCAAHDLIQAGLRPTIFEADHKPGGLLWQGIAPYRLPPEVLQQEIDNILALGVELRLNQPIDTPDQIEDLKKQGYAAVILTIGASQDRNLGLPGEEFSGVRGCVEFLNGLWRGEKPGRLGRVAVIGGGNAAIEAARTCLRFGAESVSILYRRSKDEMPADPHEIEQVLEEGARLVPLASPLAFTGEGGKLSGIEFQAMQLGKPDASGRPRPVPIKGSTFTIEAETAIISIGQGVDPTCVLSDELPLSGRGTVDLRQDGSCLPGVYAAGDLVSGPSSVVQAMASGRKAALSVCRALGWDASSIPIPPEPNEQRGDYPKLPSALPQEERYTCPHREASLRVNDCEEVVGAYSPEQAMAEAKRCLQCGVCAECYGCQNACELGAIDHLRPVRTESVLFERVLLAGAKPPAGLQSDLIVSIPRFGKKQSMTKAVVAGRSAAMQVVSPSLISPPAVLPQNQDKIQFRRIGVMVCSCNETLLPGGGLESLLEPAGDWPGVAHIEVLRSACHPDEGQRIEEIITQKELDGLVLGSCACCDLDLVCESCTDQRIRLKHRLFNDPALERSGVILLNLRDTVLLPHGNDLRAAGSLARRMLLGGLHSLRGRQNQRRARLDSRNTALVLGAGQAGQAAALSLAAGGRPVTLLYKDTLPPDEAGELAAAGVDCKDAHEPLGLTGGPGNFSLTAKGPSGRIELKAGLVILDRLEYQKLPYRSHPLAKGSPLSGGRPFASLETQVPGVYLAAWPRAKSVTLSALGLASAGEALEGLALFAGGSGRDRAYVDSELCRGCGGCVEVCPQGAPRLLAGQNGLEVSAIEPALCAACGTCQAVCPTGAIAGVESEQKLYQEVLDALC
jgi:NADPH-dependent glutamate synthase beta subunit-like oxidoreductase/NAD-dependent dihydropyrimidine dehydrogenase PreA subunit